IRWVNVEHKSYADYVRKITLYEGDCSDLPPHTKYLSFVQNSNQPNQSVNIPSTITHLTFGDKFDQPIDNLPPNITHLTSGENFNQKIENLPPKITQLIFGMKFNQNIDNLPNNIKYLKLKCMFNQNVDNLPTS